MKYVAWAFLVFGGLNAFLAMSVLLMSVWGLWSLDIVAFDIGVAHGFIGFLASLAGVGIRGGTK